MNMKSIAGDEMADRVASRMARKLVAQRVERKRIRRSEREMYVRIWVDLGFGASVKEVQAAGRALKAQRKKELPRGFTNVETEMPPTVMYINGHLELAEEFVVHGGEHIIDSMHGK